MFLVDISDDALHASGRELYRTISPVGRFQVVDRTVTTYAIESMNGDLPNTIDELERQITEAISALQTNQ